MLCREDGGALQWTWAAVRRPGSHWKAWRALDREDPPCHRQTGRAAEVAEAAPGVRQLDERSFSREYPQRVHRCGLRGDGCLPAAHVPGADQARRADGAVVRVGERAARRRTRAVAAAECLDRRLSGGPAARRRADPASLARAGGGAVPEL